MELRQLRYFVAVADTLNFSRAAESLYLSQSALSKQIQALEQELGVVLFERDRRSVLLTQAGQVLLPEAKSLLLRADKLVPLLRHETDEAQRQRHIMIGVEPRADGDSLIHRILTETIYQERKKRPGLRALFMQMEYSDMKKALAEEEIDLALFLHAGEPLGAPLTLAPLWEDEMVLAFRSSRAYPDDLDTVREVLDKRGVILLESEMRGMSQVLQILGRIGSTPQIRFSGTRLAMCLSIESGESAAILPRSVVHRLAHPDVQQLSLRAAGGVERIWLAAAWRETERETDLVPGIVRAAMESIEQLKCENATKNEEEAER